MRKGKILTVTFSLDGEYYDQRSHTIAVGVYTSMFVYATPSTKIHPQLCIRYRRIVILI